MEWNAKCENCGADSRIIFSQHVEIERLKDDVIDLQHRLKEKGHPIWLPTPDKIDGPDDVWVYAIVDSYRGCQEYGDILMWWTEENVPSMEARVRLCDLLNGSPELVASFRLRGY